MAGFRVPPGTHHGGRSIPQIQISIPQIQISRIFGRNLWRGVFFSDLKISNEKTGVDPYHLWIVSENVFGGQICNLEKQSTKILGPLKNKKTIFTIETQAKKQLLLVFLLAEEFI